jgi:hypothetical protein
MSYSSKEDIMHGIVAQGKICKKCGKRIPQQYLTAHMKWEASNKSYPMPDAEHKALHKKLRKIRKASH